jgi:Ser/Thr protein kinase RdoA (MazF antagonist)
MAKFDEENQLNVTQENLSIILKEYEIMDFTFEVFSLGIANTSVKIITSDKIYVLRVYCFGRKPDAEIIIESEFQDYLREKGVPIPTIYKNKNNNELSHIEVEGRTWQVILMEFKGGTHLNDYPANLLVELAQIQAKMHILGMDFAKNIKNHNRVMREMYDTILPTKHEVTVPPGHNLEIKPFMERARAMKVQINSNLPHGYNHLDLDFEGNILIKDNHISAILDFDDLTYSACIICLGYTMWHILFVTGDWDKVNFYLSEYRKVRDLTTLELKTLPEIMLFRNYVLGIIEFALHKNYERVEKILSLEKPIQEAKFV